MIGIQNAGPMANSVKFGHDGGYYSADSINQERDEKLRDVNEMQDQFNSLAQTLEGNNDKVSQRASKVARGIAAVVGLGVSFVTAKYGSKFAINVLKNAATSAPVKSIVGQVKNLGGPAKKVLEGAGTLIEKSGVRNTKVVQKAVEIINKEPVQKVITKVGEIAGKGLKAAKGFNYQGVAENILGVSAVCAEVIDDVDRNTDRSNLELAMGVSGGDK